MSHLRENVRDCFRCYNIMLEALMAIDREAGGCRPDCTKEFHRLALDSVQSIARAAIKRVTVSESGD